MNKQKLPSKEEFKEMLNKVDWLYDYCDDPAVFSRSQLYYNHVLDISKQSTEFSNMFESMRQIKQNPII